MTLRESVVEDLRWFGRENGRLLLSAAEKLLSVDPSAESRNMKTLRPNPVAQRELRLFSKYRVLFSVDPAHHIVSVVAVGEKRGDSLIVQGKEFTCHEGDPPE